MNNMNIKLEKVRLEDRNKLERLLQLYLHDLSLYFPITFNSDICQYEYDLDKYFIDNYAYFIKNDKDILGFVLIDDNGNNNYEISEIFVLNNYKRKFSYILLSLLLVTQYNSKIFLSSVRITMLDD